MLLKGTAAVSLAGVLSWWVRSICGSMIRRLGQRARPKPGTNKIPRARGRGPVQWNSRRKPATCAVASKHHRNTVTGCQSNGKTGAGVKVSLLWHHQEGVWSASYFFCSLASSLVDWYAIALYCNSVYFQFCFLRLCGEFNFHFAVNVLQPVAKLHVSPSFWTVSILC